MVMHKSPDTRFLDRYGDTSEDLAINAHQLHLIFQSRARAYIELQLVLYDVNSMPLQVGTVER